MTSIFFGHSSIFGFHASSILSVFFTLISDCSVPHTQRLNSFLGYFVTIDRPSTKIFFILIYLSFFFPFHSSLFMLFCDGPFFASFILLLFIAKFCTTVLTPPIWSDYLTKKKALVKDIWPAYSTSLPLPSSVISIKKLFTRFLFIRTLTYSFSKTAISAYLSWKT